MRERHLKDIKAFWDAAAQGTLPAVVFVKPDGANNQHPGESTMAAGDLMAATIVETLRRSPQWKGMAIIVSHDENGGFWDPMAPPRGDRWGPGSRIPTVIASPHAKKGFVDHTVYDTTSILQFISALRTPALAGRSDAVRRSPECIRIPLVGRRRKPDDENSRTDGPAAPRARPFGPATAMG